MGREKIQGEGKGEEAMFVLAEKLHAHVEKKDVSTREQKYARKPTGTLHEEGGEQKLFQLRSSCIEHPVRLISGRNVRKENLQRHFMTCLRVAHDLFILLSCRFTEIVDRLIVYLFQSFLISQPTLLFLINAFLLSLKCKF